MVNSKTVYSMVKANTTGLMAAATMVTLKMAISMEKVLTLL